MALTVKQAGREFHLLAPCYAMHGVATIEEIRRANLLALTKLHGGNKGLALKIDKSEAQVSQWVNGSKDSKTGRPRNISSDSCRTIETTLKLDPGWMDSEHSSEGLITRPVAQSLSLELAQDAFHVVWGEHMHKGSPIFWVALPDDSMAPRAPAGKNVCFDTRLDPRPGDGVLVQDRAGALYFRLYRPATGTRWSAEAINDKYLPLDSERDGLKVVAVLKAEDGRWA